MPFETMIKSEQLRVLMKTLRQNDMRRDRDLCRACAN